MDKKDLELNEEDLAAISGGIQNLDECSHFMYAAGCISTIVKCENCFWYHQDKTTGKMICGYVNGQSSKR